MHLTTTNFLCYHLWYREFAEPYRASAPRIYSTDRRPWRNRLLYRQCHGCGAAPIERLVGRCRRMFSGGSSYGEEAITAVATGLKDNGARSGDLSNIAYVPGAVIYDFGGRRFNEVYPDKRLAQTALRAVRPGVFPLGAQGASFEDFRISSGARMSI